MMVYMCPITTVIGTAVHANVLLISMLAQYGSGI